MLNSPPSASSGHIVVSSSYIARVAAGDRFNQYLGDRHPLRWLLGTHTHSGRLGRWRCSRARLCRYGSLFVSGLLLLLRQVDPGVSMDTLIDGGLVDRKTRSLLIITTLLAARAVSTLFSSSTPPFFEFSLPLSLSRFCSTRLVMTQKRTWTRADTSEFLGLLRQFHNLFSRYYSENDHVVVSLLEPLMRLLQCFRVHQGAADFRPPRIRGNSVLGGIFQRCNTLPFRMRIFREWNFSRWLKNASWPQILLLLSRFDELDPSGPIVLVLTR